MWLIMCASFGLVISQVSAPPIAPPRMWEYKVVDGRSARGLRKNWSPEDEKKWVDGLSELGTEGWELVAIAYNGEEVVFGAPSSATNFLYYKRPIQSERRSKWQYKLVDLKEILRPGADRIAESKAGDRIYRESGNDWKLAAVLGPCFGGVRSFGLVTKEGLPPPEVSAPVWEYRSVKGTITGGLPGFWGPESIRQWIDGLSQFGKEGWEVIAIAYNGEESTVGPDTAAKSVYYKRAMQSERRLKWEYKLIDLEDLLRPTLEKESPEAMSVDRIGRESAEGWELAAVMNHVDGPRSFRRYFLMKRSVR
jgi:hypothetical protein